MSVIVEYGVPTDKCGLQLRLGIARGFFREEGLDFALRVVFGGPEIAAEFDAGCLKIGELGTPPGLTALARGARFNSLLRPLTSPPGRTWSASASERSAAAVAAIGSCDRF